MSEKDFFAVVLKTGGFIKYESIKEFRKIPFKSVACYLKAEYDRTFTGPVNITNWYRFSIVDIDGNPDRYQIGDFEVVDIGVDDGMTNFFGRDIVIHNMKNDECYTWRSHDYYQTFIIDEIRPLLIQLNNCQSAEEIAEVLNAPISYDSLKESFDNLKSKLTQIKNILEDIL